MNRRKRKITLELPEEFLDLCADDMVEPERVLRGFIADLCSIISWAACPRADGYCSNGSDERLLAKEYYQRVGYPYEAEYMRQVTEAKSPGNQAANLNCRDRQFNLTPDMMTASRLRHKLFSNVSSVSVPYPSGLMTASRKRHKQRHLAREGFSALSIGLDDCITIAGSSACALRNGFQCPIHRA